MPWEEGHASVLSHSMQRGSLVFDVGVLRETSSGEPALFRPREHIERFLRSAALVGLDVPWSAAALLEATLSTVVARGVSSALVRWSAFLASPEVDVVPRAGAKTGVVIAVLAPEDAVPPGELPVIRPVTVRVALSSDIRKADPTVLPPQAKVAAAYLGPMLAKRRAVADGYDEVVLLDRDGFVAEAPTSNVFAVRAGELVTPSTERVLAGITRASVLELARAEGIPARESSLSPADFVSADEAFLAGTSLPVLPIAAIDGTAMCGGAPGPVTARIRSLLLACERGQDPRFAHWLVRVR